jgi:hypothetical protein
VCSELIAAGCQCRTAREVYALYLRYEDVLKIQGLWDDADYTLDLLTSSKLEPLSTVRSLLSDLLISSQLMRSK